MWTIIIFLIIFLLFVFHKRRNYPPGPLQLPIIGNILQVWWQLKKLKYHHRVWQKWSQKYGPVVGLRLGFLNVVVISGKEMIKEVASRDVFNGRPNGFFYLLRSYGEKIGLVFSDGPYWNKIRRATLSSLKNYGFGGSGIENLISEECKAIIELRMADSGKPVYANHMFDVSVINILWRLVAGKRYDLNDERLLHLSYLITKLFRVVDMSGGLLNFMPILRYVIPDLIGYTELTYLHDTLLNFIKETIQEHKFSLDVNNPRDLIDTFLIEMQQNKELYSEKDLEILCVDFFEAGVETVSNTAGFLMLYMVLDHDIQNRIRTEIDTEIGRSRAPLLSDRSRMVYTEAVIMEALRITSVAAVGIPHMTLDDARLGEYVIPKGTTVLFALYDLHHGDHWKEPATFRPERFLAENGKLVQDDWLMPFGSGKRRCIGEGLAKAELFLFLTSILQNFSLKLPEGDPVPTTDPINGVTLSSVDFRLIFEPRNNITSQD